jgi:hypothetical protein
MVLSIGSDAFKLKREAEYSALPQITSGAATISRPANLLVAAYQPSRRAPGPHIEAMQHLDLTDDEAAALAQESFTKSSRKTATVRVFWVRRGLKRWYRSLPPDAVLLHPASLHDRKPPFAAAR